MRVSVRLRACKDTPGCEGVGEGARVRVCGVREYSMKS